MREVLKNSWYVLGTLVLAIAAVIWLKQADQAEPAPASPGSEQIDEPRAPLRGHPAPLPPEESPGQLRPDQPANPPSSLPTHYVSTWEEQIDQVLTSQEGQKELTRRLQSMFDRLPVEGQVEAAGHLANLTDDEDYTLGNILGDPQTPREALEILMVDLSHRPDRIRLPLLAQLVRAENHPLREEALEELTFLLDADHGTDWAAWEKAVQQSLNAEF